MKLITGQELVMAVGNLQRFQSLSAKAIIRTPENKFCLQRRDSTEPHNPGALACFGGGMEAEDKGCMLAALQRELVQELSLSFNPYLARPICGVQKNLKGGVRRLAVYFEVIGNDSIVARKCTEGKPEFFRTPQEILQEKSLSNSVRAILPIMHRAPRVDSRALGLR